MIFVTLGVDSGRPRWICDALALGATPGKRAFQGLQWGGEVEGVSPACGTEMQRTGQEERDNQSYQASWEVFEKANVLSL